MLWEFLRNPATLNRTPYVHIGPPYSSDTLPNANLHNFYEKTQRPKYWVLWTLQLPSIIPQLPTIKYPKGSIKVLLGGGSWLDPLLGFKVTREKKV